MFVAGNTNETGILQLVLSDPGAKAVSPLWTLRGKVATEPVLSVKDGNSLFVVQNEKLRQYDWFDTNANGPKGRDKLEPKEPVEMGEALPCLWMVATRSTGLRRSYRGVQFTSDGTIIGYQKNAVYDISPNSGAKLSPKNSHRARNTAPKPSPFRLTPRVGSQRTPK